MPTLALALREASAQMPLPLGLRVTLTLIVRSSIGLWPALGLTRISLPSRQAVAARSAGALTRLSQLSTVIAAKLLILLKGIA